MKSHSSKAPSRETVLEAVRCAVKTAGGKRVSLYEFLTTSGMKSGDVFLHFSRWQEALRAAGFASKWPNALIDTDVLLADWSAVARDLRRLPKRDDYSIRGNFSSKTLENRFGSWTNVSEAFLALARKKPEWAGLGELVSTFPKLRPGRCLPERPPGLPKSRWLTRRARRRLKVNLPLCGVPLDYGVFRYAPTNEIGVILLFGSMAERLGFRFETVRPSFPDCKAVREAGPDVWEIVRIEFEFQSGNFRKHEHDPKECDLIVCWEHNWPECPVEVLALKDEIKRLKGGD
jgi:hypothetical protein